MPIDKLAEQLRQIENRMTALEKLLALQGDINGKLLEQMNRVFVETNKKPSSIILPERLNS